MTVIRHESTCCGTCHVYYEPGYEGACQEPDCGGTVSYDAAIDAVRDQLAGAVGLLDEAEPLLREAADMLDGGEHAKRFRALADRIATAEWGQ